MGSIEAGSTAPAPPPTDMSGVHLMATLTTSAAAALIRPSESVRFRFGTCANERGEGGEADAGCDHRGRAMPLTRARCFGLWRAVVDARLDVKRQARRGN